MTDTSTPFKPLEGMLLADLKRMAGALGLKGTTAMRKGDLVAAIKAQQNGGQHAPSSEQAATQQTAAPRRTRSTAEPATAADVAETVSPRADAGERPAEATPAVVHESVPEAAADDVAARLAALGLPETSDDADQANRRRRSRVGNGAGLTERRDDVTDDAAAPEASIPADLRQQPRFDDDDPNSSRRNRRRRNRDRQNRRQRPGVSPVMERLETEPVVADGDVLVTVSGILDVLDNYAFVRTTGYLPGPNDAYVSLSLVRRYGLRKGDLVTGSLRQPKDGERREKFNPLVQLETVNGSEPENARNRPEFAKLTPLYPQERLRLEDSATNMTGRIMDLIAPIGKGQRGLIVSPPKAGKTMVMQAIAESDFLLHGSGPSVVAEKDVARCRKETGKPYGIYGVTIGSVSDSLRELLTYARFTYCRDSVSLKLIQSAGVKCPIMEFGPDGAFATDLRNDAAAEAFLDFNGLTPRKFLCVIPRLRFTPYWTIPSKKRPFDAKRHARPPRACRKASLCR